MTIAYNWKITETNYLTSDKYIFCVHWTASAVDGDFTASIYSTCSFGEGSPSIPYSAVTEQEVLSWCWANGVDKAATEAALAAQIELQKNPVQESGLPWATA